MGGSCSCQWTVIWKSENMCCWCNVLLCNTLFFSSFFFFFMADHAISAMGNYYVVLYLATEDVNWPRKRKKKKKKKKKPTRKCKYFHLQAFIWLFYQQLYKRTTFFASKLNSPEGIHVGSHFVNEEQGRLVNILIQSCRAQNVNTRGRFFFLQDFQTSFSITRTKRRVKICRIFLSFFLFLLISFSLSVCPSVRLFLVLSVAVFVIWDRFVKKPT